MEVMSEIIRRTNIKKNDEDLTHNNSPLNNAFKALPEHNKMIALQGGYQSMAKEFGGLAKQEQGSTITIKRPLSMSEELAKKYPLLAVEKMEGGEKTSDNEEDSTSSSSFSSSSTSSSSSLSTSSPSINNNNEDTIKKISF
jgi:hypothetical protein